MPPWGGLRAPAGPPPWLQDALAAPGGVLIPGNPRRPSSSLVLWKFSRGTGSHPLPEPIAEPIPGAREEGDSSQTTGLGGGEMQAHLDQLSPGEISDPGVVLEEGREAPTLSQACPLWRMGASIHSGL